MSERSLLPPKAEIPSWDEWQREAEAAYTGSDAVKTRRFCARLEAAGAAGRIAAHLFRAQKASERAKCYRGGVSGVGSYRDLAYARKGEALKKLCHALELDAASLSVTWGWKLDPGVTFQGKPSWVLYVDLPRFHQVSFHSPERFDGPDYRGEWDGEKNRSAWRILAFSGAVLGGESFDRRGRAKRREQRQLAFCWELPEARLQQGTAGRGP